jgi:hypothetical protein
VGKPLCALRDGNSHAHPQEGATLAREILNRLKAPKKTIQRIHALVEWHMYDFDCKTSENKLRRFFVAHLDILEDLIDLKQADFSACTDNFSTAPTCERWKALLTKMKEEKAPMRLKDLALNGTHLLQLGIAERHISTILNALLFHTVIHPSENNTPRLRKLALGFYNQIKE